MPAKMNSEEPKKRPRKKPSKLKKAPGAPRRFKSAYMFYSTEKHKSIRAELIAAGRSEPTTAIAKMVSKAWKELPLAEREAFNEMARKDKARYNVEKSMYTGPWRVSTKKRAPRDSKAPKRPMSAFLDFSHTKRPEVRLEHPNANNTEMSRILAEKWRNAPESEKKEFIEREQVQRDQYKESIAVWRAAEKEKLDRERSQREEQAMQRADELAQERRDDAGKGSEAVAFQVQQRAQISEGKQQTSSQHPVMSGRAAQQLSSSTYYPGYYDGQETTNGSFVPSSQAYYGTASAEQQPYLHHQNQEQTRDQEQMQHDSTTRAANPNYDPRYYNYYSYQSAYYQPPGYDGYQWSTYGGKGS